MPTKPEEVQRHSEGFLSPSRMSGLMRTSIFWMPLFSLITFHSTTSIDTNWKMISRFQIFLSVLLSVLLLFGCKASNKATVSYDSSSNQRTIETRSYKVSTVSGASLGSQSSINVQAIARCRGRTCKPQSAKLVFIAPTNQELSFSGIGGEIVADNAQVIDWTTREAGRSGVDVGSGIGGETSISAYGPFAAVRLNPDQIKQIVQASSVEGTIGGKPLRFESGVKAGLKDLLRHMQTENADRQAMQ